MQLYRIKNGFLVIIFLSGSYGLWFWATWHKGYESARHLVFDENSSHFKTILLYTPIDGGYTGWRREFPTPLLHCRDQTQEYTCRITSDHEYLDSSSAVIVSLSDINSWTWTWLPIDHHPPDKQKWLAVWGEAPQFFFRATTFKSARALKSLDDLFAWTVSYRHDSDFIGSYFHKDEQTRMDYCTWTKGDEHRELDEDAIMSRKSDLALWVVSHCTTTSHRERYVSEMQKFVPVTILGTCGDLGPDDHAFESLGWHKFYLSFENSLCDDYITEKFFNILNSNTVPVVMGPKKEDYVRVAPPNSFIHVSDFSGPKELSEHLIYLDDNPQEYLKYFAWKKEYRIECQESWSCNLCRNLYNQSVMEDKRKVSDFMTMWEKSVCYSDWNYTLLATQ